jgi:transcriptional regulator with XRE-family HTH domain
MVNEMGFVIMDSGQLRAARAWLGWSQGELADKAGVGRGVVAEYERGARLPYESSKDALIAALNEAGITFSGSAVEGKAIHFRSPERSSSV